MNRDEYMLLLAILLLKSYTGNSTFAHLGLISNIPLLVYAVFTLLSLNPHHALPSL
jgi:hypothetical protein